MCNRRPYVFQQDSVFSPNVRTNQVWMHANFYDHFLSDAWSPRSSNLNLLYNSV